jgi:maleylacetoacetate isomerase
MTEIVFYDYWRSSAAYRVRIVLNLKGIDFRAAEIDLANGGQSSEDYLAVNPQGLVPALEVNGEVISQSLAIIDYLDARFPKPQMLPADPVERARTLSQALVIGADAHPLNNLRVQKFLRNELGVDDVGVERWLHHWLRTGFEVLELQAPDDGFFGGDNLNLADVYIVPQMANARRFKLPLDDFPRLVRLDEAARAIDAVAMAAPDAVRPPR